MIKKKLIVAYLIFALVPLTYAQSFIPKGVYKPVISDMMLIKPSESHFTVIPFVGFDTFVVAHGGSIGIDVKYLHSSGVAMYLNSAFLAAFYPYEVERPISNNINRISTTTRAKTEIITEVKPILAFSGEALIGYSKTLSGRHTLACAIGAQLAYGLGIVEFAGAIRLEYLYLITRKYGIHLSFTDGVGFMFVSDGNSFNRVTLKAGPVIYF